MDSGRSRMTVLVRNANISFISIISTFYSLDAPTIISPWCMVWTTHCLILFMLCIHLLFFFKRPMSIDLCYSIICVLHLYSWETHETLGNRDTIRPPPYSVGIYWTDFWSNFSETIHPIFTGFSSLIFGIQKLRNSLSARN